MSTTFQPIDGLCINTIRTLSIDAVQKANSGHPGMPLGAAPMAYVLWTRHLRHNPTNPKWPDRDRFVLSAGHASMLLYSLLQGRKVRTSQSKAPSKASAKLGLGDPAESATETNRPDSSG